MCCDATATDETIIDQHFLIVLGLNNSNPVVADLIRLR
jgi:hypothetical protein